MDTDTIPVTGVEELEKHLDELVADPNLDLNAKLFDHVELQLTDANIPPLIPKLLPKLTEILKKYPQDPKILCSLAIKLLAPLNFTQILSLASEEALILALQSPAPSANILAMTVLEKAAKSPGDAAILAMMNSMIKSFIIQWLSAPQVEVGEKGSKILGDLLDIDCDTRPPDGLSVNGMEIVVRKPPGQGLLWRRIFNDRDIYDLILSLCTNHPLGTQQQSLAQGRLLRVLPRLAALNFRAVTWSDFADLNQKYTDSTNNRGILHFAALFMVDKEDMLMHLNLIDFFEALLSIQRITPFSTHKIDTLKNIVRDATAQDNVLKAAILTLPERTVPEEADELRQFIQEILNSE
ncbi:uncharacterized protein F4812DRAFT_463380 [Daldinia caldariorum]|uniref:uncharacterized protein n=1 Tax=Daldinia caldariorum TaxID=326644 RepID=UPI002007C843|nr:uncharacterized protein F4812DRAFT_463380 [Daldinia caldariorum]KAI1463820.1 hypothetical protein F4812DRAFT_463380 [Daldinia caldariorum]